MKILLILIGLLFLLMQVVTTYLWIETDMLEMYISTFTSLYKGGVPVWSRFAFSVGFGWYGLSLITLLSLIVGSAKNKLRNVFYVSVFVSVISTISMWYALYPLHLMLFNGANI